jgi:hypothetical protein
VSGLSSPSVQSTNKAIAQLTLMIIKPKRTRLHYIKYTTKHQHYRDFYVFVNPVTILAKIAGDKKPEPFGGFTLKIAFV